MSFCSKCGQTDFLSKIKTKECKLEELPATCHTIQAFSCARHLFLLSFSRVWKQQLPLIFFMFIFQGLLRLLRGLCWLAVWTDGFVGCDSCGVVFTRPPTQKLASSRCCRKQNKKKQQPKTQSVKRPRGRKQQQQQQRVFPLRAWCDR